MARKRNVNAVKFAPLVGEYSANIESFIKPKSKPKPKPKTRTRKRTNVPSVKPSLIESRKATNQSKKEKYVRPMTTRLQARKAANQSKKVANMTPKERRKELQTLIQSRKGTTMG